MSIFNLERDLITHFSESKEITLLNEVKGSSGNPNANKLYICFDSHVEYDELGEWDFKLGEYYPINID